MDIPALFAEVRDLLLPTTCAACGTIGPWWCGPCEQSAPPRPVWLDAAGVRVAAAGDYESVAAVVLAYKQHGVAALHDRLVERLAVAVTHAGTDGSVLVPIPATRRGMRQRGRDIVADLAEGVSLRLGVPVAPALSWSGSHRVQKGLTRPQRMRNMQATLVATRREIPGGRHPLIVDDVLVTGATIAAGAAALASVGFPGAGGAVVCASHAGPNRIAPMQPLAPVTG